jgi:hypothetical protein
MCSDPKLHTLIITQNFALRKPAVLLHAEDDLSSPGLKAPGVSRSCFINKDKKTKELFFDIFQTILKAIGFTILKPETIKSCEALLSLAQTKLDTEIIDETFIEKITELKDKILEETKNQEKFDNLRSETKYFLDRANVSFKMQPAKTIKTSKQKTKAKIN